MQQKTINQEAKEMNWKIKDDEAYPIEVILCPFCGARLFNYLKRFD